jgi:copper transport protein
MIARAAAWAVLVLALLPAVAQAHASLVRTSPGDTAVLPSAPATVRMQFSEPVDLGPKSVQLLDAGGKAIKTSAPTHAAPDTAQLRLPRGLARGTYVVSWRVVSADSHPVSGAFSFSVGAPSAVVDTSARGVNKVVGGLDAVFRAVSFGGLAVTLGGACLLLALWPDGRRSRRGRRLLWAGIWALLGGTLVVLLLQGPYAAGDSVAGVLKPSMLSFSLGTRFGHALIIRLLLAGAFAALVALGLRGGVDRRLRWALAACALGLVLTWTLVDHSRTGVQTWLGVPAASVHLLAMALWLGGLTLLLFAVLDRRDESLPVAVGRFSRLALICFVALGVTGVYLAYRQSGELPAIPNTGFGRLLLVKSAIVLGIVGLAYFSRRAVQRGAPGSIRRTVAGEAILGVGVLGVTAALVNAAPARVSYAPPFDATVAAPADSGPLRGGHVQVHMEPAKEGQNVTDVYLVQRGGALYSAPEINARMVPPSAGVGALKVPLTAAEPGHYVADRLNVPFTGQWTLRLEVRTSEVDESDIEMPVRIR